MRLKRLSAMVLFAAAATAAAIAQNDHAIDNFTSGAYQSPSYSSGEYSSVQEGSMLGGNRLTVISLCNDAITCGASNAYNQTSSYGIFAGNANHPASIEETAGFGTHSSLDLEYGASVGLDANFSKYDRIRVNFLGLVGHLNFSVLLETNDGIDAYADDDCAFGFSGRTFSIELPFEDFNASTGFNLAHVEALAFVFNNDSGVGGTGYAVSSIQLSDHNQFGAIICKLPPSSAKAR